MITKLMLTHFVLIEKAEISFGPHFNCVTGETGAGKSAILEALSLVLGARADTSFIRQGNERAVVEAAFDICANTSAHTLLEETDIPFERDEELIIRREITLEGKNRATVNCHLVPLPFLQKMGAVLIDFVDQNALQEMRSGDFQRSLLDIFGGAKEILLAFQVSYKKEKALQERLEELKKKEAEREKREEFLRESLEEIISLNLKEDEDEELYQLYQRLTHSQEMGEKLREILEKIHSSPSGILIQLNRVQKLAESLCKIDSVLSEPLGMVQQASIALQEAHLQWNSYFANLEQDPNTLNHLEERLSSIARLKKKYGKTLAEIHTIQKKMQQELLEYDALSLTLSGMHEQLSQSRAETNRCAKALSAQRKECATDLQMRLSTILQSLNMSKAQVQIALSPQNRTQDGDDQIHFWLKANTGENPSLVREHASGGELSRLFLAIKLALADKNKTPTLIFDEIDANVGGKTASIIGEKLAELGKVRQILCITHFPQVAAKAACQFSVRKQERNGRTVTQIALLSPKERQEELVRMLGGERIFTTEI
ncbi:MAG TPA: DNA repair protein RecN [Rhabdochlamydiaceae bacterium]|jgi:DNA repair protein RecN (Recombination protein N)